MEQVQAAGKNAFALCTKIAFPSWIAKRLSKMTWCRCVCCSVHFSQEEAEVKRSLHVV